MSTLKKVGIGFGVLVVLVALSKSKKTEQAPVTKTDSTEKAVAAKPIVVRVTGEVRPVLVTAGERFFVELDVENRGKKNIDSVEVVISGPDFGDDMQPRFNSWPEAKQKGTLFTKPDLVFDQAVKKGDGCNKT